MATILIVEDDPSAMTLTSARLKPFYSVRCARDGEEALRALEHHHVDLAVVDAMMPNLDGFGFVEALRSVNDTLPVLMLTALDTHEAKRSGWDLGVDDYLVKPVHEDELLWRVRALLRRAEIAASCTVTAGAVVLDATAQSATIDGVAVDLPKKEFDLLFLLASYPGMIFTKDQLLERVWGFHSADDEATLKTHVSRLRKRLEACDGTRIVNIRGLGYKLVVTAGEGNLRGGAR